jgi:hypothetical protein
MWRWARRQTGLQQCSTGRDQGFGQLRAIFGASWAAGGRAEICALYKVYGTGNSPRSGEPVESIGAGLGFGLPEAGADRPEEGP